MSQPTNERDILNNWYRHAAQLPGSVSALLQLLRNKERTTEEEQRERLGADPDSFSRLKAMRAPRPQSFVDDARRIADICHLQNRNEFVSWMLLARNLREHMIAPEPSEQYYEAAFDAFDGLDDIPEDDAE